MTDPVPPVSRLDQLFEERIVLPSLPGTLARLTELLEDPGCALVDVARVVEADPSMTLRILGIVNSPLYGLRQTVTSIAHAVTLLGAMTIKHVVMTATVLETLRRDDAYLLRHSMACGVAVRALVAYQAPPGVALDQSEAFICGLLHDIGKQILNDYLAAERGQALELSRREDIPVAVAEQRVLGTDHAEAGARLAQAWKLPAKFAEAIAGHHDLARCAHSELRPLAALMAVGDFICNTSGIAADPAAGSQEPGESVWTTAGLTSRDMPPVLDRFFAELPTIEDFLLMAL